MAIFLVGLIVLSVAGAGTSGRATPPPPPLGTTQHLLFDDVNGSRMTIAMTPATEGSFTLGGNLWPSPQLPAAVAATGMQLVRLWVDNGLGGDDTPVNVTPAQADSWANITVHQHGNLNRLHTFAVDAASHGVRILLGGGGFGKPYLVKGLPSTLDEARVADAARIWAAVVARMSAADCMVQAPAFIELSNEPNGHWTTYIAPSTWAKLVCAVRAALDARGLQAVGISGPGTSLGSSAAYLSALANADGLTCVALIAVHTWEDTATPQGPHEMAGLLARYQLLRARYDIGHTKLWVATEYGARTNSIGGHTWSPDRTVNQCYDTTPCYNTSSVECQIPSDAEILAPAYATRVAAFTLLHLNARFDAVLYWWVADYGWSPLCFGLTTRTGSSTPTQRMFTEIFMAPGYGLPTLHPVARTWLDGDTVTAAAVGLHGQSAVLWVAHAPTNGTGVLRQSYSVVDLPSGSAVAGSACYPSGCVVTSSASQSVDGSIPVDVTLQPNSIIAIFFKGLPL